MRELENYTQREGVHTWQEWEKASEDNERKTREVGQHGIISTALSSVKSMAVKLQVGKSRMSGVISDSSMRPRQQSSSYLLHMSPRERPFSYYLYSAELAGYCSS